MDSLRRIHALDGLRGLALLLLLYQQFLPRSFYQGVPWGRVGVDLMFVLAGFFAMGGLLRAREDSAGVPRAACAFLATRLKRIAPVTLGAVLLLSLGGSYAPRTLASLFTFTYNFDIAARGQFGDGASHLWTLSALIQLYLVATLVLIPLPRRYLVAALLTMVALGPLSRLFFLLDGDAVTARVTPSSRLDAFGLGALLYLGHTVVASRSGASWSRRALLILGLPIFVAGVALQFGHKPGTPTPVVQQLLLSTRGPFLAWVVGAGLSVSWFARLLSWQPLAALGRRSLGTYVAYGLLQTLMPKLSGLPDELRFALLAGATILIGCVTYRFVERPLLGGPPTAPATGVASPPRPKPRRLPRRLVLASLSLLATLAIAEIVARAATSRALNQMPVVHGPGGAFPLVPFRPDASVVERWQSAARRARFMVLDPELGWTLSPSARAESKGPTGRRLIYETNSQGIRSAPARVFDKQPPMGVTRVVAVGDSFTFGADLPLEETWTELMESMAEDLEVINLGVQSYGTDQALLRWEGLGRSFEPHIALMVIWPEDVLRNLNVYRYYMMPRSGFLMAKPRFVLDAGELRLVHSPAPAAEDVARVLLSPRPGDFEHEGWFAREEVLPTTSDGLRLARIFRSMRTLNQRRVRRVELYSGADPEALDLAVAIAQRFAEGAREHGSRPVVVVLPQQDLLDSGEAGFPLASLLRERGIETIDLGASFADLQDPLTYFFESGHFNARGARLVAELLLLALRLSE